MVTINSINVNPSRRLMGRFLMGFLEIGVAYT